MSALQDDVDVQAQEYLSGVSTAHPYPTWTMSPQGHVVTANDALQAYLGISLGQLQGRALTAVHPDDQAALPPAATGPLHQLRLRRHDGSYRWFQVAAQALRNDGHLQGWLLAGVDIQAVMD